MAGIATINAVEKVRLVADDLVDIDGNTVPEGSIGHATLIGENDHYKLVFKDTNRRDALQGRIAYIYHTDFSEVCELLS